jgi:protein-S-isoprenylcysteine O-methyltransferase Ste14
LKFKNQLNSIGVWLVLLQFGVLLLLCLSAFRQFPANGWPSVSMALAVLSGLLGVWTLAHNRLGNFNIRPTPKVGGALVTSGPYAYMRHPMYGAVLLAAAALGWLSAPVVGVTLWAALLAVLWVKASLEETALKQLYPSYFIYAQSVKRFIPWLL